MLFLSLESTNILSQDDDDCILRERRRIGDANLVVLGGTRVPGFIILCNGDEFDDTSPFYIPVSLVFPLVYLYLFVFKLRLCSYCVIGEEEWIFINKYNTEDPVNFFIQNHTNEYTEVRKQLQNKLI